MNIALIANDKRKELLVQFCTAYSGILRVHSLCATNSTGKLIAEATRLPITLYPPGSQGGVQRIAARVAYNEIDMLLYFRDPQGQGTSDDEDFDSITRLCDSFNIPFATNIATAEVLIQGLRRGDLGWRDIVNPMAGKATIG
ncbi:MAG: methylglyoxal synthase [Oscillospiraceae bacterium]|jgi:methylglyoxal synthase|nr:methylglyoxal synthase [Oscillospiraceae bacterium]